MLESEKELWKDVLEAYREMSFLWDPKDGNYQNKKMRLEAYEMMMQIYHKIDPNGTLNVFKKRLENMRTAFNRERRKAKLSNANGGPPYVPTLWYYDLLSFLEEPNTSVSDMNETQESYSFNFNKSKNKIFLEKRICKGLKRERERSLSSSRSTQGFNNISTIEYSEEAKIVVLWEQQQSIKKIARDMGITKNTVRRWIQRYQATGEVNCARQGPRPVAYTEESERHRNIVQVHSEAPFKTTRSTAETYGVSLSTVRRHLHAAGIHNYKPARKIKLTETHRIDRVNFATQYLNFDWANEIVIFTDEKCFKSDKDGQKILWRRTGERFNPKNVLDLRTSGRLTLGYWGWMSSMGPGELVEIGGRMNSERYLEVLKDVMLPSDTSQSSEPSQSKRRMQNLLEKQEKFMDVASQILTRKEKDWEVIGKAIGLQLSGLQGNQQTIAHKLISDAIFYGNIGRLNLDSFIHVDTFGQESTSDIEVTTFDDL